MASSHWFVGRDGKQLGPYEFTALSRAASRAKLRPDDLVWSDGMAGWVRADALADLLPFFPKAPSTAPAPPASPAAPAAESALKATELTASGSKRSNYIARHWRGDFYLAHAYWVNNCLVGFLWFVAIAAISASGFSKSLGIRGSGWWALVVLVGSFAISVWAAVGVWHSAEHHVSRGGRPGWATTAKVVVALGLLRLVGTTTEQAPIIQQSLLLASGHDTVRASQLRVINRATEVEVAGGLSFGTADALKTVLDATPTVRLVQLNNTGGWIDEGDKVGQLVDARKLATYTARECDSACLIVFMAGEERYIGSSGKLGFHEASIAGIGGEVAKDGTQTIREALARKGVPETFITRALSTPASSIWYPTTQELLDAHVITAVVDDRVFGETGINGWRDRVKMEQEFATIPIFAALARAEPKAYERLRDNYISGVQGGLSEAEMTAQVRSVIIGQMLPKYLPKAPNEPLIGYYESQTAEMRELRALDSNDCVAFLYPKGDDSSRVTARLSHHARETDLARLSTLLVAAAENPASLPTEASVLPALRKAITSVEKDMPGAMQVIGKQDRSTMHPTQLCDAMTAFYDAVLALPPQEAGPVLRYLASQK